MQHVHSPGLHQGRANSARGSKTTLHCSVVLPETSGSWLPVDIPCTVAQCEAPRQP